MVTLRHCREREAAQLRINRMQAARRQGSEIGVQSARYYQQAKQQQREFVELAIHERVAQDARAKEVDVIRSLTIADHNRGSGMRAAETLSATQGRVAALELDSWAADRELQHERFKLAMRKSYFEKNLEMQKRSEISSERQRIRDYDDSVRIKNKPREIVAAKANIPSEAADRVLLVPDSVNECNAVELARIHEVKQQAERQQKMEKVMTHRRETERRACEALMQQRHKQLVRQQQEERETELQKNLMEATLKRINRPGQAEFQEEEARRAQRLHHQAHLDFEKTFLAKDGWDESDLLQGRLRLQSTEEDDSARLLAPVDENYLTRCMFALPCHEEALHRNDPNCTTEVSTDSEDS